MVALSISRQAEYPPTGKPAKTGSRSSRADAVGPDAASASHRQELEANMSRDNAIVMRYDNPDIPSGRDIVYLHGRGSTEREAGFALPLFGRANVRSYRGPLPRRADVPPTGKPVKPGGRVRLYDAVGPDAASAAHRQNL